MDGIPARLTKDALIFEFPPPGEGDPDVELVRWAVYELPQVHSRHFVGWSVGDGWGRVSTTIQAFDPATRIGVSRSGRRYHLDDTLTEVDADGYAVWVAWLRGIDPAIAADVSTEYA